MNPNNQLLLGIVLIGLGILIAVLAFMVLTGRREKEIPTEDDGEEAEEPPALSSELETEYSDLDIPITEPENSEETEGFADDEILEPLTEASVEPEPEQEAELESAQGDSPPSEIPSQPLLDSQPRTEIAMLMRDGESGKLIVRIGEQEYASASELRESEDWARVEFASKDLARWMAHEIKPESPPKPDVEEHPAKPKSMVEQINAILQQKIAETPGDQKAIRLIEGPGGSVRVLLGVQSYNLDEVPDPEARELIRQAVAAWEDLQ
jgi:hypothetical protein